MRREKRNWCYLWRQSLNVFLLILMISGVFSSTALAAVQKFYGKQLTGPALQIYQNLENKKISGIQKYSYTAQKGITFNLKVRKTKNEYWKNALKASDAYLYDYSEAFWIGSFYFSYDYDRYNRVFRNTIYPEDRYQGVRNDITEARKVLNKAIKTIRKKSSRYAKVKAAHDYVANLIDYDYSYPRPARSNCITGALLSKYQHLAVCEAYARIFQLLCDACNIPCILVSGGSSTNNWGQINWDHMWNYVKMENGKWYLVDVTWDDQDYGIDYTYFLAGSDSKGFNGERIKTDHLPSGVLRDTLSYKAFKLPTLTSKKYKKK